MSSDAVVGAPFIVESPLPLLDLEPVLDVCAEDFLVAVLGAELFFFDDGLESLVDSASFESLLFGSDWDDASFGSWLLGELLPELGAVELQLKVHIAKKDMTVKNEQP